MGAIKAYKDGDKLIPVDTAKVVKAYQCPWTSKLYVSKKAYVKHLADLRETRVHARIRDARLHKMLVDFNSQNDFTSIIDWVERNSHWFLARAKHTAGRFYAKHNWPDPEDFWIRITYLDVVHSDCVSNSHAAPRGGVTNWGGRTPNAPRGYPGWHGRIEYRTSHHLPGWSSDIFNFAGIHTGTGGGLRGNRYGYGVTMFDSDWPGLDQLRVLGILSETNWKEFTWGTPYYILGN